MYTSYAVASVFRNNVQAAHNAQVWEVEKMLCISNMNKGTTKTPKCLGTMDTPLPALNREVLTILGITMVLTTGIQWSRLS